MRWKQRIEAWWRVLWGNCPTCNCDGPATDTCSTCNNYRHSNKNGWEHPSWSQRMAWLAYWEAKHEGFLFRCVWQEIEDKNDSRTT